MENIYKKLNNKQRKILEYSLMLIRNYGRSSDIEHIFGILDNMLNYEYKMKFNKDIFVPLAILHDIGHISLLPEHLKYVTGAKKITNSKLVHMLTGAKIANDVLLKFNYPKNYKDEIVEIISMHDADSIKEWGVKYYNTKNKKLFHDFDRLDVFNEKRIKKFIKDMGEDNIDYLKNIFQKTLNNFFYEEIEKTAVLKYNKLKEELKI